MALRSIAVRFWLSFASYEKPPTFGTQRAGQTSGFCSDKKWQHQVTERKTPNKMAKASQLRSFLGYIFICIYIYIFFSYAACDFKPKLRNHFFQSQARCHMLLLVAGIADIDCRQPWGIVQIFRWVTLAVQLYV